MTEFLILGAFGGLQLFFHNVEKAAHKQGLIHKLCHSHYLVWVAHPVVSHTIQEYAVHVVIYSGKIIGH